ncbi:galactokinase [Sphingomonas lacunae]|uniref:Galactokinase n=1 Tax=Sphingomonas lacunae TaxID=2698828 RepID=A0A6M4AWZ8_9SPHN|nr:galactokinase [Sphingomonas lacunae]QJQ32872.1 galactokinase [Sphingomonas lacunae]
MTIRYGDISALFTRHFGGLADVVTAAPGRVNLIGEHTDYNDGFVLPMGIDRHTMVAARRRNDGQVHLIAGDLGGATASFPVGSGPAAMATDGWTNYVRGMAALMPAHGVSISGADIAIAGDMPRGAGLSSSAALENAVGLAFAALDGQPDFDRALLARVGQQAEHAFAGCHCGIMDQLVSACAHPGHALLIDCRSLARQSVALPAGFEVMIVHSGVVRGLVDGEYNVRRAQCEMAARHFAVPALRDLDLAQLVGPWAAGLDAVSLRRARHVVSENARTLAMAKALTSGDMVQAGRLMAESHASMRDDFAITVPPVDALAVLLQEAIGEEGGARMTGGGFGGAVVAILPTDRVASVSAAVHAAYRTPSGQPATIMLASASGGVSCIAPD